MKAGYSNDGAGGFYQMNAFTGGFRTIITGTNITNQITGDLWNTIHFPGFGRKDTNSMLYYDDIYVATGPYAQARVEIGNAPIYNNSTNLAILTPTSWSNSLIVATVRQGSFTSGQTAYLYVFDANGNVNTNGYPVTIGSGASITGDINQDGVVNVLDVQKLVNIILGIEPSVGSADVNSDGSVDVLDVQSVVNIILGV